MFYCNKVGLKIMTFFFFELVTATKGKPCTHVGEEMRMCKQRIGVYSPTLSVLLNNTNPPQLANTECIGAF